MCEWCTEHGKGKKWYFAVDNYVRSFGDLRGWLKEWSNNLREAQGRLWGPVSAEMDELKSRLSPRLEKLADVDWEEGYCKHRAAQVVTLAESREMCDVADVNGGFVKLACVCRKYKRGGKFAGPENLYCLGISAYASMYEEHPERVWRHHRIETVSAEEAKEHLERTTDEGNFHLTSFVGTPAYLSNLCSCEYPVCVWLQWRMDWGLSGTLKKGHYVASQDFDKCDGCMDCIDGCQFRAISHSPSYGKAIFKQESCFGCANCMRVCPQNAGRWWRGRRWSP